MNPYADIAGRSVYKGDLHLHSTRSDGQCSPEEMFDRLINCGFDFCCLTDHDLPGRTHSHRDLLVLMGQEASAESGHVVVLSSPVVRTAEWTTAEQLSAFRASGGYTILSHPKIREFTPKQGPTYTARRLLCELPGLFDGIEVYTHNVGSGPRVAIDRLDVVWSAMILAWGAQVDGEFRPVWAFGASDGHHVDHITENVGIAVWAVALSPAALLESIVRGAFYVLADTKARFSDISLHGDTLRACASQAVMLRVFKAGGRPAWTATGRAGEPVELRYTLRGDEGYVRVEAMDADGRSAYSNPIFIGKLT